MPPLQEYYNQGSNHNYDDGDLYIPHPAPPPAATFSNGPPPQYFQPPYRTQQPIAYTRPRPSSRAFSVVLFVRPFSLIIPGVIVILNIWWSVTQRVCPGDATVGDTCFWMLWLSLPIATLSFIWAIVFNISGRRRSHHMSHIPRPVQAAIQLLLAVGATICFALLIYHLVHFDIWSQSYEGAMAALLGILMLTDWVLFSWTAYEIHKDYQVHHQHTTSQIPI
ncbi:hypothetical protein BGZ63DRAFT_245172 [Mariannaea sp. PMI_226]|nr:hypothetical protein BGZ63DRAFT_245172 [Mariannaea sp. PMI_226]